MPRGETKHLKKHQFKPGQSGNPSGFPKMDPRSRVIKELTLAAYRNCVDLVCTGNIAALEAMKNDATIPAIQMAVAAALATAMRTGDYDTIEKIVSRVIGKIPEEININSTNVNQNTNLNASVDEAVVKAALERLKSTV